MMDGRMVGRAMGTRWTDRMGRKDVRPVSKRIYKDGWWADERTYGCTVLRKYERADVESDNETDERADRPRSDGRKNVRTVGRKDQRKHGGRTSTDERTDRWTGGWTHGRWADREMDARMGGATGERTYRQTGGRACVRAITCKDTLTNDEGMKDKLRINSIRTEDKASKRTTGCSDGRSLLTNGLTNEKDRWTGGRTELVALQLENCTTLYSDGKLDN